MIISNTTQDGGSGGGIYCNYSEALIKDCRIVENLAIPRVARAAFGGRGGGIYCSNSNLLINGCEISDNSCAGDISGAIYSCLGEITLGDCGLNSNKSSGIYIDRGSLKMTNCLISHNNYYGIKCSDSNEVIIKNCHIVENQGTGVFFYEDNDILIDQCLIAANRGRGIYTRNVNSISINNCTITDNSTGYYGTGFYHDSINCSIRNCIVWGNKPIQIKLYASSIDNTLCTISYSNTQGAVEAVSIVGNFSLNWSEGNINLDPDFVMPGYIYDNNTRWNNIDDFWILGDYHLKSHAGRWDPNNQTWVQEDVTSPCIDAGDPASPIGLEPFPNGGIVNMGAYGGTAEASKSYFGEPVCETIISGDINGDCRVDIADFVIMVQHWLENYNP
jgi:hypothetical protein